MQTWRVTYSLDGTSVELDSMPWWVLAAEEAGDWLLHVTHPALCCWDWEPLYKVLRWGPLDEDGWTEKSAGYALHRLGWWIGAGFGVHRREHHHGRLPVTIAWLKDHGIDTGWIEDLEEGRAARADSTGPDCD